MTEYKNRRRYTDAELVDHLRDLADGGEMPTESTIDAADGPSGLTYYNRFGSLEDAADAADLSYTYKTHSGGPKYSDEELLTHLRNLANGGEMPTAREIDAADGPPSPTFYGRFGSLEDAADAADLSYSDDRHNKNAQTYSDSQLISHLTGLSENGGMPTENEIRAAEGPSESTYRRRFGSLKAAADAAGLSCAEWRQRSTETYTDAELLDRLRALSEGGEMPIQRRINNADGASAQTYRNRFGSLKAAADAAGLSYDSERHGVSKQYSDAELLSWLEVYYDEYEVVPRPKDFKNPESPMPSASTYRFRFGSWRAALEEAGLSGRSNGGDGR